MTLFSNDFDNTKVSGGTVAQLYHPALVRILVFQSSACGHYNYFWI
ncbi:MAG: hypothetical protein ACOVSR_09085 [Bacteroidia bacterium]